MIASIFDNPSQARSDMSDNMLAMTDTAIANIIAGLALAVSLVVAFVTNRSNRSTERKAIEANERAADAQQQIATILLAATAPPPDYDWALEPLSTSMWRLRNVGTQPALDVHAFDAERPDMRATRIDDDAKVVESGQSVRVIVLHSMGGSTRRLTVEWTTLDGTTNAMTLGVEW